jgi:hypothetical protein
MRYIKIIKTKCNVFPGYVPESRIITIGYNEMDSVWNVLLLDNSWYTCENKFYANPFEEL